MTKDVQIIIPASQAIVEKKEEAVSVIIENAKFNFKKDDAFKFGSIVYLKMNIIKWKDVLKPYFKNNLFTLHKSNPVIFSEMLESGTHKGFEDRVVFILKK